MLSATWLEVFGVVWSFRSTHLSLRRHLEVLSGPLQLSWLPLLDSWAEDSRGSSADQPCGSEAHSLPDLWFRRRAERATGPVTRWTLRASLTTTSTSCRVVFVLFGGAFLAQELSGPVCVLLLLHNRLWLLLFTLLVKLYR